MPAVLKSSARKRSPNHRAARPCVEWCEPRYLLSTLPGPWADADIGASASGGSASITLTPGTSSVSASVSAKSGDIWGTADSFHFVYESMTGDGQIIAQVNSVQNTATWAKAGVMLRDSLSANARYADMVIAPGNFAAFQYRTTAGGSAAGTYNTGVAAPRYVKLVRSANTFTGYYSADGITWTQQGASQTITMGSTIYVGLAVSSNNTTTLNTSTFSHIVIPQNILTYGASTGAADNTAAINNAINASNSSGKEVSVPPGQFKHSGQIELNNGVYLHGAGGFGVQPGTGLVSELRSTNGNAEPIHLTGSADKLRDIKITTDYTGSRLSLTSNTAVFIDGADHFLVESVDVVGSASAGIFIYNGANSGGINNNHVSGTLADGIHMTNGVNHLSITNNQITGVGDDSIAVVSYTGNPLGWSGWITIAYNTCTATGMTNGRGITVVGGHDVTIDDNSITDTPQSGIYIASEVGIDYYTFNVSNVTITRNTITHANTTHLGSHGGILITGRDGYSVDGVTVGSLTNSAMANVITRSVGPGVNIGVYTSNTLIANNTVDSSSGTGVAVGSTSTANVSYNLITNSGGPGVTIGDNATGITFANNTVDGAGGIGVQVTNSNAVAINYNVIKNTHSYGIFFHGNNSGVTTITGNTLQNLNSDNVSYVDAILIEGGSTFSSLAITNNDYTNPAGYVIERFIECHFPAAVVTGNTTNTGKPIWVG